MSEISEQPSAPEPAPPRRGRRKVIAVLLLVALMTAVISALVSIMLVNIWTRKQEARSTFVRLVDVNESTSDPIPWGTNFPHEYDGYLRTSETSKTRFGGSDAMPAEKIERDPWLKRMFAGYAFSLDYRDRRGHAFMLFDQAHTERVLKRPQPGACLHCHASIIPTYRRIGASALGQQITDANDFNWPSVMKGFEKVSAMTYADAFAEVQATPDGSANTTIPAKSATLPPSSQPAIAAQAGGKAHPVSCIDCHDPRTMELRVTRPGFVRGIQALATSEDPVPHLASIGRWRQGNRATPYDPNANASRQEMRSFVCGQCHVEYYCGPKVTLFFPWNNGLKVEQIESYYDSYKFPDGHRFYDYAHGETGAEILKAQHPEFETWSQGTHARAGVSCADCHMPYTRQGAAKVSDHWVRSPALNISRACQQCHPFSEAELQSRIEIIQTRTRDLMQRAGVAIVSLIDSIRIAKASGATPVELQPALELQRKAQWRLDFVAAENSMGFHAPQETARILGEAIDYARQGEIQSIKVTPGAIAPKPATMPATIPVLGITPAGKAP